MTLSRKKRIPFDGGNYVEFTEPGIPEQTQAWKTLAERARNEGWSLDEVREFAEMLGLDLTGIREWWNEQAA